MKFTVLQEDFQKILAVAVRNVAARPQLPVLNHLLLSVADGRLKISATNLETGVNLWMGAKIDQEGAISVPAKLLMEYVNSLPAGQLAIEMKENILYLSAGKAEASLHGMNAAEFPKIPSVQGEPVLELPADTFIAAVNQVVFAAAGDDARPVLTGVYTFIKGGQLYFVSTDGYRLSSRVVSDALPTGLDKTLEGGLIVPAKAFLEAAKIAKEAGESIRFYFLSEANQVVFVVGKAEIVSRLIEGQFPDFEKIIPDDFSLTVDVDMDEFRRAVKMASIFARENANIVRLTVTDGQVEIAANKSQVGSNKTVVEAQTKGEGETIAFNSRYLIDFLGVVDSERFVLQMSGPLKPGMFKIQGNESFLHVIMPVRVQD
ncbi:DNA polymerase III subunit beta [Patescibacteria group bacterium]|nr:DNA polymerase III subunit beta [Patescibacteria group bacterium]